MCRSRVTRLITTLVLVLAWSIAAPAPPAIAHSSFLGSSPEPGTRLNAAPHRVVLTFTEGLNAKLSQATLVRLATNNAVPARIGVVGPRLVLVPKGGLARGAYSLRWHSVASDDGHALEGSFSFGVQAPAAGGEHDVEQSPLARDGWLRVLARTAMYATLLLFAGALVLRELLGGGRSWLAPPALSSAAGLDVASVAARERALLTDVGLMAVGASALSTLADGVDAAGGLSAAGLRDFLLGSQAGLARLGVVVLLLVAVMVALRRPRLASLPALGALGALALSGHAASVSPRALAVAVDWLHLLAAAVWLGGIAIIVLVWGPALRRGSVAARLAVARSVLPVFGRVALPAFLLAIGTGVVSALVELGRVDALWQTDYGRVLVVKMALVVLVAAASYAHALRLRPRLLAANPHPDARTERRHWRLLRAEPIIGLGVVGAVGLLVAFPLPPRQLRDEAQARTSTPSCRSCPLPSPTAGELAVAEQGGSDIVAAWVRHRRGAIEGAVRLYGFSQKPAPDPFTVAGARQNSCGPGCQRFSLAGSPPTLTVRLRQRRRLYTAVLPTRYLPGQQRRARRLLSAAQATMRALRSVREREVVSSVPGFFARTDYRLAAPNRLAYRTNGQVSTVIIGLTQWDRPDPRQPWQKGQYGGGLRFRFRSWFDWSTYARHVYLLGTTREAGHRVATVALMDQGTPAWWRLSIDLATHRVLRSRLVTYGHFMTQRYFAFNDPLSIQPPRSHAGH